MIAGVYFAGAPFGGLLQIGGRLAVGFAAAATITVTADATISEPPARLGGAATIVVTASAVQLTFPPLDTTAGISIGGIAVTGRVRMAGVQVHDILNDAPNTATFTLEGEAPAVGQRVRITIGARLLFAGAVQTVGQAYESAPRHRVWHITAIDDTAEANARRPLGTWFETSATTIAQSLTTTFAPGFSTSGIAAGLPAVTIVFDAADPFIACLARLATAIGGYCKIDDRVVYLFTEDLTAAPAPLDDAHRFLASPPIQMTTDSSQLRTRVYGKGYGENVPSDIAAGETLIPIQDGALFPPLGGTAIVALTADGAQSDRIAFASVERSAGGTLVGTGSSPTSPPALQLQAGPGVTSGVHTLSVAYTTAAGRSLAGPPGTVTAGTHPPPAAAPLPTAPTAGTGPDQGSHEYAVAFVLPYGETVPGPISPPITTTASAGSIGPPSSVALGGTFQVGPGLDEGAHDYKTTFVNAIGETDGGANSGYMSPTRTDPVNVYAPFGGYAVTTGGSLDPGQYYYYFTGVTATGESLPVWFGQDIAVPLGSNAVQVPIGVQSDPRITFIKIYRGYNVSLSTNAHYLATVSVPTGPFDAQYLDTTAPASNAGNPAPPTVDTTTGPVARLFLSSIPLGPAGTTGRRLYRRFQGVGPWKRVTSITNNTETTYLDTTPNSGLGVDIPASNTTGSAVQRVPVTNIPIGPLGVTARALYRRFNGAGPFKLVTTIANNTGTSYTDATPNSGLGAAALGTATAVANQILAALPIGPAAVTGRELYMSHAGGGPRYVIGIWNDNTTTSVLVGTPDGSISSTPEPTADTSGLQQPNGQVNPGSSSLPVASAAPFKTTGGWVQLGGGQTVRYTGMSTQALTGIPASGPGAITTAVLYGQQAVPAPMLVGVTGLTRPIAKGSAVHLWIQRDDLQAQAEHAARTGGDGIVEFLIVDQRRGVPSLAARCDADLARFSRPIVTVTYATRDLLTKSGKPITFNLPSQGIQTTLTIQDVTITEIGLVPGLAPRFTVTASSVRFSLEDTLRRLVTVGPVSVQT